MEIVFNQSPSRSQLHDIARIHGQSFQDAWPVPVLLELLAMDGVHLYTAAADGLADRCVGFLIARIVADEAEILTIATDNKLRRRGVGRKLLKELINNLDQGDCKRLFLEVATTNIAAKALYESEQFEAVGKRVGYYAKDKSSAVDAVIMRRELA